MHSLLMQSGDYSDDNEVENDEHDVYSDESHEENDISVSMVATNWQHKSRLKRKQKQIQSDLKKSKLDNTEPIVSQKNATEAFHIVYLRGQSTKLTSRNPVTICQAIKSSFGPVQKVERRGTSLKLTCLSAKQRDVILGCSQLEDTSVIPSLPYSETRKLHKCSP